MPMAPMLPPDQMAQAQTTGGINPAQFLIAAADMHNSGTLSAPVPSGSDLVPSKNRPQRRKGNLKVLK